MLFSRETFIGIDPSAGRRPVVYAAIDQNLELMALGQGSLDEVTAFAGGQRSALVAVNAPRQPNTGLMKDEAYRNSLRPVPHPGRWEAYRVVEYQLYQHGISIPHTAGVSTDCPRWMQMGFAVYQRLIRLGYALFPAEGAECQVLETYPHAAFTTLLGLIPFPKNSLEGRLQRQLALHEAGLKVPNPMRIFEEITRFRLLNGVLPLENLFSIQELDALVAAYTAWYAANQPDRQIQLGDPGEGQIFLPVENLKSTYSATAGRPFSQNTTQ
jgi:hypothetical protein